MACLKSQPGHGGARHKFRPCDPVLLSGAWRRRFQAPELLKLLRYEVSTGKHRGPRLKPPSSMKAASTAVPTPPWRPEQKEGQEGKGKRIGTRLQGGHGEIALSLFFFFVKTSMKGKRGRMREKSSKNKLSNKPSCALITLEAITA